MTSYPASKARARFSELLGLAAYGKDRVVIERSGKRVAALVPIEDFDFLETFASEARDAATATGLAALGQSEAKYRAIVEHSPDGVLVQRDGRIVFANPSAVAMYRADGPEALIGRCTVDLIHPDDRSLMLARRRELERENRPTRYSEMRRLRLDGSAFHAETISAPIIWDGAPAIIIMIRDIASRRRAEEEAERYDRRFKDFAEASADWFWETDAEFRFTYMSAKVERVTGAPPEWHYGKTWRDMTAEPADSEEHRRHEETLRARLPFRDFTFRQIDRPAGADAFPKWIRVSGKPVYARNGTFLGYRGSATDITEQKRAEEALKDSEERYALAMQGAKECLWSWDATTNLVTLSPVGIAILGLEPEFLTAPPSDWWQYVHPEDRDSRKAAIRSLLAGRIDHYECEYRIRRRDGAYIWIRDRGTAFWDENGRPTRMAGWIADITERKRTECALRESEAILSAMIENSPLFISIKDSDGRYMRINSRYLDAFGLAGVDYIGKTARDLFEPEIADVSEAHDRAVIDSNAAVMREMPITLPDGQTLELLITKFPIQDPSGEVIGVGHIGTDMTERRAMEEQLHQAQKMEAVGQLTGGVAHDFNNLLTVVQGNLELLGEIVKEPRGRRQLESAKAAASRGAELTHRLLAFSRRAPLEARAVLPRQVLPGFVELLRGTLDESVTISTELPDGLWHMMTDPAQLESALLNLAVNARDAMVEGGTLIFAAANVTLSAADVAAEPDAEPGDYVMLSVTDDGPGMSSDVREHVFEPFFTTKEVGKGSGLGLSMVYGFVKQSGGKVVIDSAPGRGTTVKLYLPRATRAQCAAARPPETIVNASGEGETVLVVEDDAAVRELVVGLIGGLGYRTLEAEDGQAALALLEAEPAIALLFTDIVLPNGMSGPDIARAAVSRHPDLKVVFTSGYTQDSMLRATRKGPPLDLLKKPYRKADLARRLAASLKG